MSNNNVTGDSESLNATEVRKKQMKKKYENPDYFNEKTQDAYEPKDNAVTQDADMSPQPQIQDNIVSDDGHKRAQNPKEEEYIPNDSYPIDEAEAQKNRKPKTPHKTLPFE